MKSAYLPGEIEPISFSWNAAYAGQIVIERSASSRVMRWSGYHPPGGQFFASWRVTAEWKVMIGLTCSTGKSVPFGITTPVLSSERHAYAPRMRSGPSRRSAQACRSSGGLACMLGMTPSCAKRGMSCGEMICACSMRKRVIGRRHRVERSLVRVEHVAVAAIADGVRAHLEAVLEAPRSRAPCKCSGVETSSPVFALSSLYGASSAAPREPSAPSA